MKRLFGSLLLAFLLSDCFAQCNTQLIQFLPDRAPTNDDRFGVAIDATDKYLVMGATNSDTLGIFYGGIAYVFEKTPAGWAYRAMLKSSNSKAYDFLGTDVAIDDTGNTIVVSDRRLPGNRLHIYEKPAGGWQTMTETTMLTAPDYSDWPSLDISPDGSTITLGVPFASKNIFFVYQKPVGGWNNTVSPEVVTSPESDIVFGSQVLISGDYFYVSPNYYTYGGIYVYKKNGATTQYLAKLSLSSPPGVKVHYGKSISAIDNKIAALGLIYDNGVYSGTKLFIYKKTGEWTNSSESVQITIPELEDQFPNQIVQFISPTEIVISAVTHKSASERHGRVVLVTAQDASWQNVTTSILYAEDFLPSPNDFGLDIAWNGTDLLMGTGSKTIGNSKRHAVVSLTRAGGIWGSLQHVSIDRFNSADFDLGQAVIKTATALLAGAPGDNAAGKYTGAVYVYEKSGNDYVRSHKILPSPRKTRPTGGTDGAFGYSLASYGDELAIGAPYFRYSTSSTGKIFLYKKTTASWKSAVLYDSLSAPDSLLMTEIGYTVAMNDHVLFASAFNNSGLGGSAPEENHQHSVLIYERINGKWKYRQAINLGKPLQKRPTLSLSLHGDVLAAGSWLAVNGGVFIIVKNPVTGKWESQAAFGAGIFTNFGSDVKLTGDHLFIGASGYDYKGVTKSGCVVVYSKLPGTQWNSAMQPSTVLGAKTPVEGGFFGHSIDVIGNTLVAGAPGGFLTLSNEVRTVPGNVYVIQTEDYFWNNTVQFLNLQGERYASQERDYFGFDVAADQENFFIGSSNENTSKGSFSGAVYTVPAPPIIFPSPPVCHDKNMVQLKGYPFDGTWSGPGVEDPSGKFNPGTTGPGVFILTYKTVNCAYEGKYRMEVRSGPSVTLISPENVQICSETPTRLQVSSVPDARYQWFFKPEAESTYAFLGDGTNEKVVTVPGNYYALVFDAYCSAPSPIITVKIEGVQLTIGPQPVVCRHQQQIKPIISETSGTWEGTGISNNFFYSGNLPNGKYALTYRFTTPLGCHIAVKDTIELKIVTPFTIERVPNDFCEEGAVTIITKPEDTTLGYTWYYGTTATDAPVVIEKELASRARVYLQGYYSAVGSNGACTATSNNLKIGFDTDLKYTFVTENKSVQLCNADQYVLNIDTRTGTDLTWYYQEKADDDLSAITEAKVDNTLVASATGYYSVHGEYGFCSFDTAPAFVELKKDTVWVPNIFTPNGDALNETFNIMTASDDYSLRIFNRFGSEVFYSSKQDPPWDGGDASSGTYYYIISYPSCDQHRKEVKGWVHLMR